MEKWKIQKVANVGLEVLSDKDLYALCKEYGGKARLWARKFAFLLPEVARRGLHRKYKCESIYEFSAKLAGMSREVTYRILSLAGRLKEMPKLWNLIKKYGWSKLQIIVSVVTPQNEDFWIDKVITMSKGTLEVFIRELKKQKNEETGSLFGESNFVPEKKAKTQIYPLNQPQNAGAQNLGNEKSEEDSVAVNFGIENPATEIVTGIANDGYGSLTNASKLHAFRKLKFQVDGATEIDFRVFKSELEKVRKEAITMGEALRALLEIAELAKMLSRCMPKEYRSMFPYWR